MARIQMYIAPGVLGRLRRSFSSFGGDLGHSSALLGTDRGLLLQFAYCEPAWWRSQESRIKPS
jgi:hypothetical protein